MPVSAAPDDPVVPVADGTVVDPVEPPLELLCDVPVGDPAARALVLLG